MEVKTRDEFEKLKEFPVFKGVVVTDSMEPLIRVGDKIIVTVGDKDLKRFDIIVFWKNDRLTCHYVWAMNRVVEPILVQTVKIFFQTLSFLVLIRIFMSWLAPHASGGLAQFIFSTTEPVLGFFRTLPLRVGLFDFSPLVTLLALDLAQYLALKLIVAIFG